MNNKKNKKIYKKKLPIVVDLFLKLWCIMVRIRLHCVICVISSRTIFSIQSGQCKRIQLLSISKWDEFVFIRIHNLCFFMRYSISSDWLIDRYWRDVNIFLLFQVYPYIYTLTVFDNGELWHLPLLQLCSQC